jgi:hypothetical protein
MVGFNKGDVEMMQQASGVAKAMIEAMAEQKLTIGIVTMASCSILAQALHQTREDCGEEEFETMLKACMLTLSQLKDDRVASNVVLN